MSGDGGVADAMIEILAVVPNGPGNADEFVGEGDGGLVVANPSFEFDGPGLYSAEGRLALIRKLFGAGEDGAGRKSGPITHNSVCGCPCRLRNEFAMGGGRPLGRRG